MLYRVEDALVRALPRKRPSFLVSYLGATLFVGISFFIRWAFKNSWQGYPFLLFMPAIFLSALFFDRASGLYATALSAALAAYFFIEPVGRLEVNATTIAPFVAFVLIASGIAFLTQLLRHALHRIVEGEEEKDLLLRELAHRTKNDFMMIIALIKLQGRNQPPETREMLNALADRIGVMAAVHDQLQRQDQYAVVCVRDYLEALCRSLANLVREARAVSVKVEAEPVNVTIRNAIPIGLIVNELVTNSLKYAFPEGRSGTVEVGFEMADTETAVIVVHDDGIGCPESPREGTGSQIVRLMARQMKGTVAREPAGRGCRSVVHLKLQPA